jgi:hypothetical protein
MNTLSKPAFPVSLIRIAELLSCLNADGDLLQEQLDGAATKLGFDAGYIQEILIAADSVTKLMLDVKKNDYPSFTLGFDIVTGNVQQEIMPMSSSYDEDAIIEGLTKGTLVTTICYDVGGTEYIDVTETGEHVAIVYGQSVDGEYDFNVEY